ncbi:leupaxin isoform X5 [Pectobacterium phage POP12]|nr:leupaxin isoform X5 [Pectobacterium phage POP12]
MIPIIVPTRIQKPTTRSFRKTKIPEENIGKTPTTPKTDAPIKIDTVRINPKTNPIMDNAPTVVQK